MAGCGRKWKLLKPNPMESGCDENAGNPQGRTVRRVPRTTPNQLQISYFRVDYKVSKLVPGGF